MTFPAPAWPALPIGAPVLLPGWLHLVFFGAWIPYAVIRARRRHRPGAPVPAIGTHLPRVFVQLLLLGALSAMVAWVEGIPVLPRSVPPLVPSLLAAAVLVGMVAIARPMWRDAVRRGVPRVQLLMPRTPAERAWWLAVSVAAGVTEEISWRGVQTTLLASAIGNAWLATVLCAAMFALAHANQERRSMAVIFGFALAVQALVGLTGSLLVPMLLHAAYDAVAGFSYARLGRELGYAPRAGS